MRGYWVIILLFLTLYCTTSLDTNWTFLPPVQGQWKTVVTFGGTEEDIAHGVISTTDGGFAIVGNTESTDGDFSQKKRSGSDLFLMKFDANAKQEWVKTYGGSDDDRGYKAVALSDGGYALVGYSRSNDGDASHNEGQHDNWVIRTNTMGEILWEKSFGFLGHDHAYSILATSDGGLFFNGFLDVTASNGAGQDGKSSEPTQKHGVGEFWCHKINAEGTLEWRRYFGGTNNDRSHDAIETSEGDFVVVGTSESDDVDISSPKGSYDFWVVKLNAKGNLLWEKSIGGSLYDSAEAIVENNEGEYVIAGQSYSKDGDVQAPLGSSDILMATLSKEGELKSVRSLGSSGFETVFDLDIRPDGTLLFIGHQTPQELASDQNPLRNDVLLLYTLPNGAEINRYTLSGSGLDIGYHLALRAEGDVIVVGSTTSPDGDFKNNQGNTDGFVAIWH